MFSQSNFLIFSLKKDAKSLDRLDGVWDNIVVINNRHNKRRENNGE